MVENECRKRCISLKLRHKMELKNEVHCAAMQQRFVPSFIFHDVIIILILFVFADRTLVNIVLLS